MDKTVLFNIRMTEQERADLRHDAHQHEMNASDYLRMLIRQERRKWNEKSGC